ncbi:1-(5-phosphoribosyl)-5-[(5-phosphoribosylamino)methylideneamino] imidazole-4-carboxamide isomerase [Allosphingosinicella deserti]|uniref:1-(5-phosphoribosyl)-5-[(5-phosphoribosylamino)methylideneamino] imidazole-4-carboxamide isomerase n=1 Tax=Allosphingosinicella deserti TaxID=2116704 RepID=A0A2P7QEV6_9SPHN|nr:1-(5-phosphoribosyl)-5-[(5-phosphoribosylamino)methylideneamino] imidazole-4-carboxamide isomerase [Sphingomonas deserti]PSJ36466.1 1-(5-phosphoribosyl)-5-((5-phosphoribosylamino)methylideneamino)imidazole-4-carboxamide isomerase [Sphingomonas deserti]
MIIYPAMDLMGGRVVRLAQGRFDEATTYATEPAEALAQFAAAGASWAHVVDLDGAKAGAPVQHDLIADLARSAPLTLQVAGGFRTGEQIARMFDAGVGRVVIGSLAVKQPELVQAFLAEFGGDRITLSLDVRIVDDTPFVATVGWTEDSGRSLWDIAALYPEARHLLLTDIGRDGMLAGPNFDLLHEAGTRLPHLAIQASGGVSSLDDLKRLRTDGAIVGKALWEGRITLQEAVSLASA